MPAKINWTIPAPIILAILTQAVIIGWVGATWKTTMEKDIEKDRQYTQAQFTLANGRLDALERAYAANAVLSERVKGVEVGMDALKVQNHDLKEQNQRIETKLDSVLERRR